jgi:PspC domain/Short C-terminal domain
VIAGVAGGIAERYALSPTLVRAAWVVSIFFGGLGILLAEERYARGEISAEEFRRIRDDLQSDA